MKKTLVFIILIISLSLISITYFLLRTPLVSHIEPLDHVPSNTLIFLRINEFKKLKTSFEQYEEKRISETFLFSDINRFFLFSDSLSALNDVFNQIIHQAESYIFLTAETQKTAYLILFKNSEGLSHREFDKTIVKSDFNNLSHFNIGNNKVYEFSIDKNIVLYTTLYENLILVSNTKNNIAQYIVNTKKKEIEQSVSLTKSIKTAGKKVDANVFFNYTAIVDFLSYKKTGNKKFKNKQTEKKAETWFTYDINIEKQEIVLNGLVFADDTSQYWIKKNALVFDTFSNRYNTNSSINIRMEKKTEMIEQCKKALKKQLLIYYNVTSTDIADFYNYTNNVYSYVFFKNGGEVTKSSIITTFSINDSLATHNYLKKIQEKGRNKRTRESLNINIGDSGKVQVYPFKISDFTSLVLGNQFQIAANNYYAFSKNEIAFAEQPHILAEWCNTKLKHDSIQGITEDSAVINKNTLEGYLRLDELQQLYTSLLRNPIQYCNTSQSLKFNITPDEQLVYSTIVIKKELDKYTGPRVDWRVQLSDSLDKGPFINEVNGNSGSRQILVSDITGKVYGISANGSIDWTFQLNEPVMSQFYTIDYFNNQQSQYLFNTQHWLYLIDSKGNAVEGFPIKFLNPATNGICLADLDNNKTYRIYIACNNDRVYALDKNGKKIEAWSFFQKVEKCTNPVRFFKYKKKEYIVVQGRDKIYVLNRKGKNEIEIQKKFSISGNKIWFEERAKTFRLVTTAPDGTIWSIYKNGKVESLKVGNYSTNHTFSLFDADNDRIADYIFIDANKLEVFRQDKSMAFFYTSTSDLGNNINFYNHRKAFKISIVNKKENSLYFLKSDGSVYNGFPVTGCSQQIVVKNYTKGYQLIVGDNYNFLYNYFFE